MKSLDGRKLINKMQKALIKKGIESESLIKDLKKLRPYAIEEEDPTLTRVIRMTYEHLESNGTFDIPMLPEEDPENEGEFIAQELEEGADENVESLNYLLSIMLDRENKFNREELIAYRDLLKDYE